MKILKYIFVLIIVISFLVSCETEPPQPENPIFSDVQKISVNQSGSDYLFSEIPEYVKYIQVLIFNTDPTDYVDDDKKIITNKAVILDAGNRTNYPGISRSSVNKFYTYVPAIDDFNSASEENLSGLTRILVVLGSDSGLILTHASPPYTFTF